MIRFFFKWIFKKELLELKNQIDKTKQATSDYEAKEKRIKNILQNIDVSVDVHEHKYCPSWAVISLQGRKTDYIKFIDLKNADIREIATFLRRYERDANVKIDGSPNASHFLRIRRDSMY